MASDTTLSARSHICQIRLFFSGGPQLALYGSASTVADGFIANPPVAEEFAGDFSGLLYERLIEAQDAHARACFHTPFYKRHETQEPEPHWPQQAPAAAAGLDPKLDSAALRGLNTARSNAIRLAQQARRDKRMEDEHRYQVAAADASSRAAELEEDPQIGLQLRNEALSRLLAARNLSIRIQRKARLEGRMTDEQRWFDAANYLSVDSSNLQSSGSVAGRRLIQAKHWQNVARDLRTGLA